MISDNGKEGIGQVLRDLGISEAGLAAFNKHELPGIQQATTLLISSLQAIEGLYVNLRLGNGRPGAAFRLREYEGTRYLPLPYRHAVINGTDTRQLEATLGRLDWKQDYRELEKLYTVLTGAQRKLFYQYGAALYQLIMLAADEPQGKAISNALKVKYFGGTSYERFIAPELLATVKKQATFFMSGRDGMTFQEARNLLSGRPVLKTYTDTRGIQMTEWFRIPDPGTTGSNAVVYLKNEQRFADFDLAGCIARLPLPPHNRDNLVRLLKAGEAPLVYFAHGGKAGRYQLQANPEQQDVMVLDRQGKIVDAKILPGPTMVKRSPAKQVQKKK